MRPLVGKSWIVFSTAMLVGCATIMHRGSRQWVSITSTPAGATATIDGNTTIETPGQVKLKRGKDHIVKVEKDGYASKQTIVDHEISAWVWGNILFGGLIGLAVDFISGGAYHLEPDTVNVTLAPSTTTVQSEPAAQNESQVTP